MSMASYEIPSPLRAAIVRNAERKAVMAAVFLDSLEQRLRDDGFHQGDRIRWPAGFILEIGAICEMLFWDEQGLRPNGTVTVGSWAFWASLYANYMGPEKAKLPS